MKLGKILKTYRFSIMLLISITIGCIIGLVMKEDAVILKPFGDVFLNLMFTIVIPLVFFSIASAISNMLDLKRLNKILRNTLIVFFLTGVVAAIFMLIVVKVYDPVGNSNIILETGETLEKIAVGDRIVQALTVTDFNLILSRSHMLALIVFAILFGISVSSLGKKDNIVSEWLNILSQVMMKMVKYIMYYAPIGLCAYFATLIGQFGPMLIEGYVRSLVLYIVAAIAYYFIFYTIYVYIAGGKLGVKRFYKNILPSTATALATQSSLATLPTNLEVAKNIGVPKDIREIVLPIGATMNMQGSVIGSVLKIAFLFSIFDMAFTGLDTYVIAILVAVFSGVVMSGIPGGGLIGEMLVVSLYGFPPAAFIVASTIGLIIDAPATALNVVDDITSSMLVARTTEGKNWLKGKQAR